MLKYITTGSSHGKAIITTITGFPSGVRIKAEAINSELKRRRSCAGRGPRMSLEDDRIEILKGVRSGLSTGAPIIIAIKNKKNIQLPPLTRVRPGHIDLAAAMKFLVMDGRIGAERASARETVGRVVAGSMAKALLNLFGIKVIGYTTQIGNVPINKRPKLTSLPERVDRFYTFDKEVVFTYWEPLLEEMEKIGNTVGGCFEIAGLNIPVGLGDHNHWEDRLDARLSQAIMAIPAVKGVEIGLGFGYSDKPGSLVMDLFALKNKRPILNKYGGWKRQTNYAGGIEGGLTNGESIIVKAAVKPIPTLRNPLPTVDIVTKKSCKAQVESSDICAVPAASVIGEAVVAFEIARAFISRFPGKTLTEISRQFRTYQKELRKMFK